MESFAPQVRHTPLTSSLRLREGASPWLRRGAVTAHLVWPRLGAPFTTMGTSDNNLIINALYGIYWGQNGNEGTWKRLVPRGTIGL